MFFSQSVSWRGCCCSVQVASSSNLICKTQDLKHERNARAGSTYETLHWNCGLRSKRRYLGRVTSLWRGNYTNVMRYAPSQAISFALYFYFKGLLGKFQSATRTGQHIANFVAGAAAGSFTLALVYPLDYSRVRLANDLVNAKKNRHATQMSAFDSTVTTARSVYRGFFISCAGIAIYRGLYFGLYNSLKPTFPDGIRDNIVANFLLGWGTTVVAGYISHPVDVIRRRTMLSKCQGKVQQRLLGVVKEILIKEGMRLLTKDTAFILYRSIPSAGVLAIYDWAKRNWQKL